MAAMGFVFQITMSWLCAFETGCRVLVLAVVLVLGAVSWLCAVVVLVLRALSMVPVLGAGSACGRDSGRWALALGAVSWRAGARRWRPLLTVK